jgi:hypothetical protein
MAGNQPSLKARRYEPHIQSRKEESEASKTPLQAHRRVVDRTHIWMNLFRRVLTRWEKYEFKIENNTCCEVEFVVYSVRNRAWYGLTVDLVQLIYNDRLWYH